MFGRKEQRARAKAEFLSELAAQREVTQSLVDRYEAEVRTARTAVLSVGKAREERDEYRRVLAAAIATERRREAQVEALEQERMRLESLAAAEIRAAAEQGARRQELVDRLKSAEARWSEEVIARERAVSDVSDRAWAEREAARDELVRVVVGHRSEVSAALKEAAAEIADLRTALRAAAAEGSSSSAPHSRPGAGASESAATERGLRARLLIGVSGLSTLVAVGLIPLAVMSVSDPERALFVHLASGLGPWHLVLAIGLFAGLAVALLSWAIRDIESTRSGPEGAELVPARPPVSPAAGAASESEKPPSPGTRPESVFPNPNGTRNGSGRS